MCKSSKSVSEIRISGTLFLFFLLRKVYFLATVLLKVGVLQFVVAFFPYHEPRDGEGDEAQAYGVGDGGGQGEALGGYAYIGGADEHHEETWEE